jgi:acyl-CoA reductase-like NAD-dependent aldehyde dehydrogenase
VTETTALRRYRLYLDGVEVESSAGEPIASVNPTTGEPWQSVKDASDEDVDLAVGAAAGHDEFLQIRSVGIELDEPVQAPFGLKL